MSLMHIGYDENESIFIASSDHIATDAVEEVSSVANAEYGTAVLLLSDTGTIFECNDDAGILLDCIPSRLIWQHISIILPQLAEIPLMHDGKLNPHLRLLSRIGYNFEVVGMTGARFAGIVFFNNVESNDRRFLRIILRPVSLE
jgi:hypothetical protein